MRVVTSDAGHAHDNRADPFAGLPLELELPGGIATRAPRLRMLTFALTLLLAPFGLLAAFADEPTVARLDPLSLASLGCGLAISALLLGLPLLGLVARLGSGRHVHIDARQVHILDRGWLGTRSRTIPLGSYTGLAHVVRSTLDGAHHELILAHAEPRLSVVVHRAERIGEETIERAAGLLGQPRIAARDLFSLGLGQRSLLPAAPATGLSKAA